MIGLSLAIANRRGDTFQFYTQLSNLFLLITCLINIFFTTQVLRGKRKVIPHFANLFSYMSICTTTVTFIVVLTVLSWMMGDLWWLLTNGAMLYTHTLCPIFGVVMLSFFAPEKLPKKSAVFALSPTIAYAIVGIIMNLTHNWVGPYPFLRVYDQSLLATFAWLIGMLGGAYIIARVLLLPIQADQSRN